MASVAPMTMVPRCDDEGRRSRRHARRSERSLTIASELRALVGDLLAEEDAPPRKRKFVCEVCGVRPPKLLACSRCNRTFYCGVACQRIDWQRSHSRVCQRGLCEARLREVASRIGVREREVVEACLEVTGQRVDAACALASAYLSGNIFRYDADQDLIRAFKIVFATNVKPKHLRTLERLLPSSSCEQDSLFTIYELILANLDGLGCVFDAETHRDVMHLVDFVYSDASSQKGEPAAFLALVDELLTPPFRRKRSQRLDRVRSLVDGAWASLARKRDSSANLLRNADDLHCASVARRTEKSRFHGAQRPDMREWLKRKGNWLPKSASIKDSPHPTPHFYAERSSASLPSLPEQDSFFDPC